MILFRYVQNHDMHLRYESQGREAWITIPGERVLQYSEDGEKWIAAPIVPVFPSHGD